MDFSLKKIKNWCIFLIYGSYAKKRDSKIKFKPTKFNKFKLQNIFSIIYVN